jgi:hypothetical protein
MIFLACSCGRRYKTQDKNAGKRTKCPVCGNPLVVPYPRATAERVGQADEGNAPPPWWNPKGDPEASKALLGSERGKDETPVAFLIQDNALPGAKVSSRSARWSHKLTIASGIGGAVILVIGLLLWIGNPGSTPGRSPKNEPNAPDNGPSQTAPHSEFEGPAKVRGAPETIPRSSIDRSPHEIKPSSPVARLEVAPTPASGEAAPPVSRGKVGQAKLKLLVPAYFYPAGPGLDEWERLIEAAGRVPIVAVANPASGPGENANSDYSSVVARAARRGVTVIGYVNTNYAHRPRPEVEADVDQWVRFYPEVRGIFFDAQASDAAQADYYAALREFVRKKNSGALVVSNPGTLCAEEYALRGAADVFCVFEFSSGFDNFRLPGWADHFTAGHFAALPLEVGRSEQMRDCIQMAASRGIGLIYVTDAKAPSLWDRLPSYWDAEVEAVRKVNQGLAP